MLGPGGADRRDLPRQPPSRDGGGRGGGGLCRVRRLLSDDDQGGDAPAGSVDPRLVVDDVRDALRRDRRDHARQMPRRWSRRAPISSRSASAVWSGDEAAAVQGVRRRCWKSSLTPADAGIDSRPAKSGAIRSASGAWTRSCAFRRSEIMACRNIARSDAATSPCGAAPGSPRAARRGASPPQAKPPSTGRPPRRR